MYDYHKDWCHMLAAKTKERVLETIDVILHDADKELTGTELDKIKDAWKIISLLPKKDNAEEEATEVPLNGATKVETK